MGRAMNGSQIVRSLGPSPPSHRTRRDGARGMGQAEALITRSPLLGSKSGQLFGGRRATSSSSRPIGGSAAAAMATASKGGLAYRPPAPEPYPPPFGNLSGAPVADVSPRARKKPAEQTDDTGTQKPTVHNHHPNQPNPTTASRLASTAHGRHGRKKKKPAITAPTTADGDGPGEVKLPRARVGAWAGRATHGTASLRPLRFVWFRLCAQAQHTMGLALALLSVGSKRLVPLRGGGRRQRTPGFRAVYGTASASVSHALALPWLMHQKSGEGRVGWNGRIGEIRCDKQGASQLR